MKRQDEQGYCDVSKYLYVLLFIRLYICVSFCCLFGPLTLYLKAMYVSSRPHPAL
jgi:hypothetical protein